MRFLENIFSMKDEDYHKKLTIFGIKFRFCSVKFIACEIESINQKLEHLENMQNAYDRKLKQLQKKCTLPLIWHDNFYRKIPKDYPAIFSQSEKELLIKYIKNSKNYLEFGSGGSTFLALINSDCNIVSIESDDDWLDYLRTYAIIAKNENNRLNFKYINIGKTGAYGAPVDDAMKENYPDYSKKIYDEIDSEKFDLVFVDGRFRVACALSAALNCS